MWPLITCRFSLQALCFGNSSLKRIERAWPHKRVNRRLSCRHHDYCLFFFMERNQIFRKGQLKKIILPYSFLPYHLLLTLLPLLPDSCFYRIPAVTVFSLHSRFYRMPTFTLSRFTVFHLLTYVLFWLTPALTLFPFYLIPYFTYSLFCSIPSFDLDPTLLYSLFFLDRSFTLFPLWSYFLFYLIPAIAVYTLIYALLSFILDFYLIPSFP